MKKTKVQVRRGTFETNSSSVHSITMCSGLDYDKWVNGEMIYDRDRDELVEKTEDTVNNRWHRYYTYEEFYDYHYMDHETFEDEYGIGDNRVVAFGYYGVDD